MDINLSKTIFNNKLIENIYKYGINSWYKSFIETNENDNKTNEQDNKINDIMIDNSLIIQIQNQEDLIENYNNEDLNTDNFIDLESPSEHKIFNFEDYEDSIKKTESYEELYRCSGRILRNNSSSSNLSIKRSQSTNSTYSIDSSPTSRIESDIPTGIEIYYDTFPLKWKRIKKHDDIEVIYKQKNHILPHLEIEQIMKKIPPHYDFEQVLKIYIENNQDSNSTIFQLLL
jgi:hypothetical protein